MVKMVLKLKRTKVSHSRVNILRKHKDKANFEQLNKNTQPKNAINQIINSSIQARDATERRSERDERQKENEKNTEMQRLPEQRGIECVLDKEKKYVSREIQCDIQNTIMNNETIHEQTNRTNEVTANASKPIHVDGQVDLLFINKPSDREKESILLKYKIVTEYPKLDSEKHNEMMQHSNYEENRIGEAKQNPNNNYEMNDEHVQSIQNDDEGKSKHINADDKDMDKAFNQMCEIFGGIRPIKTSNFASLKEL